MYVPRRFCFLPNTFNAPISLTGYLMVYLSRKFDSIVRQLSAFVRPWLKHDLFVYCHLSGIRCILCVLLQLHRIWLSSLERYWNHSMLWKIMFSQHCYVNFSTQCCSYTRAAISSWHRLLSTRLLTRSRVYVYSITHYPHSALVNRMLAQSIRPAGLFEVHCDESRNQINWPSW